MCPSSIGAIPMVPIKPAADALFHTVLVAAYKSLFVILVAGLLVALLKLAFLGLSDSVRRRSRRS